MILYLLDLAGVAVFAVSGALAAGRKRLDLLGVVVIATVTAIGGGTLRDLLLDRHPVFWVADPAYLGVIVGAAAATLAWTRVRPPPARALAVADALGLGFFAVSGAQIAEAQGLPALSVIIMGAMTGAAGGVIRDVLTTEIPFIFRSGELYATAAIAGVGTDLLLRQGGVPGEGAALAGIAVVVLLRLGSIFFGLHLPSFQLPRDGDDEVPPGPTT